MKRLLIILAALSASVALVACGGGGGSGGSGGSSSGSSSSGMKTVSVKQVGGAGSVLVDSSGRALYASNQERGGKVLCTGSCTSFWKPLTVSGAPRGGSLMDKLAVVKRPDGTKQVTYNGRLLYSFTQDQPGKVTGDGFSDAFGGQHFTWHVVQAGGGTSSGSAASAGQSSPGY